MIHHVIAGIPHGEYQFEDYRERFPLNYGCMASVKIIADSGDMVNYTFPALCPVAMSRPHSLGPLQHAVSDQVPVACSDTMNNVTVGGYDPRRGEHSTSYETIAGGRPGPPGMHATQARMTNTLNTPIEALEHALPFRVARYSIRHNSGGRGQFPGDGIIRERESLNVSQFVEVQSDQKRRKVIATAAEDSAHLLKYLRLFHFLAVK